MWDGAPGSTTDFHCRFSPCSSVVLKTGCHIMLPINATFLVKQFTTMQSESFLPFAKAGVSSTPQSVQECRLSPQDVLPPPQKLELPGVTPAASKQDPSLPCTAACRAAAMLCLQCGLLCLGPDFHHTQSTTARQLHSDFSYPGPDIQKPCAPPRVYFFA